MLVPRLFMTMSAFCASALANAVSVDELLMAKPADDELPEVLRGSNYTRQNLIKWVTVVRVEHSSDVQSSDDVRFVKHVLKAPREVDPVPIDPNVIVNTAKPTWYIIKDNIANYNEQGEDFACAIPQGTNWTSLTGWSERETSAAREKWVNGFGSTLVDISWKATFKYRGAIDGIGQFITRVVGLVETNYEAWPANVDAQVRIGAPTNVGSKEHPIAELRAHLEVSSGPAFMHNPVSYSYKFQGNGAWGWRRNPAAVATLIV